MPGSSNDFVGNDVWHPRILWCLAISLAGLAMGFSARKMTAPKEESSAPSPTREARPTPAPPPRRSAPVTTPKRSITIRSQDTLEDLIEADQSQLYSRLALWLMDADPEDIATYWEHHISQEKIDRNFTDLIMIGWTRADPEAACFATDGTRYSQYAWWARACHDPEAALEASINHTPPKTFYVSWGLGEFHPKWLRANLEKVPEENRTRALQGMSKWSETDEPLETIEFLNANGRRPPSGMFKQLVRRDPWGAYEMVRSQNPSIRETSKRTIINAMAKDQPAILDRLIAEESAGPWKDELETAAFKQLLTTDTQAALARAEAVESPDLRRERMAMLALKMDRDDPERTFKIAGELFASDAEALLSSAQGNSLMSQLARRDPERLMESLPKDGDIASPNFRARASAIGHWAVIDHHSALQWLETSGLSQAEKKFFKASITP